MERYDIGITEEERRKCKKVVEAFEEYFELVDDEIILDAGRFGILWLRGYFARAAEFGTQVFYDNSKELFDDLWEAWQREQLLIPVLGTPLSELDYEELYELLPVEKKEEFARKKEYFKEKAFC